MYDTYRFDYIILQLLLHLPEEVIEEARPGATKDAIIDSIIALGNIGEC